MPSGGVAKGGIVAKGNTNTIFEYQLFTDGTATPALKFTVGDSDISASAANYIGISLKYATLPIVLDQWFHVIATYDGTGISTQSGKASMKFYIDGLEIPERDLTDLSSGTYGGMETAGLPFVIGSNNGSAGTAAFNGYIAEVAIWNKALTQKEVNALDPRHGGVWMRNGQALTTKGGVLGRPTATVKSKPTGFTYDNSLYGIDSVAYGGLLK